MDVVSATLSFAAVAGLLTIVPGLDTALVLRTALAQGPRAAFATALGISTGALVWGAGAAVGVAAVLTASEVAYTVLKVGGALYLVWLGARLLRDAFRRPKTAEALPTAPPERPGGVGRSWRRGVLTNLANPKIAAFYVAVLPQFIPPGASPLGMGLLLALVHDLEGLLWFSALIFGAARLRTLLRRPAVERAVDATTGTVLIGFGVKLGLSH